MIPARFRSSSRAGPNTHAATARRGGAGSGARTADQGRPSHRGDDRLGAGLQIRLDHLPLYRQAQILAARASTSSARCWRSGRLRGFGLRPVYERLCELIEVRARSRPTRRTRRCSIRAEARPRRAISGPMPAMIGPGAVPTPRPSLLSMRPAASRSSLHLPDFSGCRPVRRLRRIQDDRRGPRPDTLAFCWAHARRNFFDIRPRTRPRSPSRRWRGSAASTPSNAISGGSELRRGWPPAKPAPNRSSWRLSPGWRP